MQNLPTLVKNRVEAGKCLILLSKRNDRSSCIHTGKPKFQNIGCGVGWIEYTEILY